MSVRERRGRLELGLYARGTHDLVPIPKCAVHHPRINDAAALIVDTARRLGISPYDEATGAGELRYVQLSAVASEAAGTADRDPMAAVQIVLVWNSPSPVPVRETPEVGVGDDAIPHRARVLAEALWEAVGGEEPAEVSTGKDEEDVDEDVNERGGKPRPVVAAAAASSAPLVHSVWINFNDGRGNVILGDAWELVRGDRWHWSRAGDAQVCYAPASFMQANTATYARLLAAIERHVPSGARLSELYAGAGAIG